MDPETGRNQLPERLMVQSRRDSSGTPGPGDLTPLPESGRIESLGWNSDGP